jgi:hypothetical protein
VSETVSPDDRAPVRGLTTGCRPQCSADTGKWKADAALPAAEALP